MDRKTEVRGRTGKMERGATHIIVFALVVPLIIGFGVVFYLLPIPFNHGEGPLIFVPATMPGRLGIARTEDGATELLFQPCGRQTKKIVVTNFEGDPRGVRIDQPLGSDALVWENTDIEHNVGPFAVRLFPPEQPNGWELRTNTYLLDDGAGPDQPIAAYSYNEGELRGMTTMPVRVTSQLTISSMSPDLVLVNEYKPLVMKRKDFFDCEVLTPELNSFLLSSYAVLWGISGVYPH